MLERKIELIELYEVFNNTLFYTKGKNNKLSVNFEQTIYNEIVDFGNLSNVFFIDNDDGETFKFDFKIKKLVNTNHIFDYMTELHLIKESNRGFEYYNKNLELEYTLSYLCPFFYMDKIAIAEFQNKKWKKIKLAGVSIDDESIVWEYDLSKELPNASYDEDEEDYVERLIGILGGKLWVLTNAGRLVVLDVETGKVLKVFSAGDKDAENGFEISFVDFYKKDGDEDYLYGIGNKYFYKLDVHQIKIVEEYCFIDDDLKEFESIMYPKLQGDYFTFFPVKKDYIFRYAGVYDYINRKTVWVEEIISEEENKKGNALIGPEPLRVHGDKLYIKDRQQNLHIFEWDKK